VCYEHGGKILARRERLEQCRAGHTKALWSAFTCNIGRHHFAHGEVRAAGASVWLETRPSNSQYAGNLI
jgi:hypothetical protein